MMQMIEISFKWVFIINNSNNKLWEDISKNFKTIRTTYYKNTSNIFPQISNQILKYN